MASQGVRLVMFVLLLAGIGEGQNLTTGFSEMQDTTTIRRNEPGNVTNYLTTKRQMDNSSWGNATMGYNDTLVEVGEDSPLWVRIMDVIQAMCSLVGFISNFVTLATLMRSNIGLGPAVSLLLRHQSSVDMVICLLASLLIIPPPMWTCGNDRLDEFLCHAWHSQAFYWQWYTASVYNLVLIALDRFICVWKPMLHSTILSKSRLLYAIVGVQTWAFVLLIPSYIQTRFENGQCLSEYPIPGNEYAFFMSVYGILIFVFFYSVPVFLFVVWYGYVIFMLRSRLSADSDLPKARVIKKASQELTKCAVTVTTIFIISTSFELWYYLLGKTMVVEYVKNSVVQKTAVFMSIINVSANPMVYALMMPVYRKNVIMTLLCRKKETKSKYDQSQSTMVSTVSKSEVTNTNI